MLNIYSYWEMQKPNKQQSFELQRLIWVGYARRTEQILIIKYQFSNDYY